MLLKDLDILNSELFQTALFIKYTDLEWDSIVTMVIKKILFSF